MIQKLLLNTQMMDGIYKNIEGCNPNKKQKILIIFNDMIADMLSNKRLNPLVPELFIRSRKLNISLIFITQSYFAVKYQTKFNTLFCYENSNKREIQQIVFYHSSGIDFQDL